MILASFRVAGREAVLQFDKEPSWLDWFVTHDSCGELFLSLGKFSVELTNHWKRDQPCLKTDINTT